MLPSVRDGDEIPLMQRLALVLVFASACGTGSVDFADYVAAYRHSQCDFLARCGEVADANVCFNSNLGFTLHIGPSYQAAIDMGKVHYDGAKAKDCFDQFANRSCDVTSASYRVTPAVCNEAVQGTIGDTGVCGLGAECKSFNCNIPACSMACCTGACVGDARATDIAIGQSCLTGSCVAGARCDFNTNVCVALKVAGDTCTSGSECGYNLGCTGTPRVCGVLPKLGEACPGGSCRDAGTTCSGTPQTCVKVGLVGAACNVSSDCSSLYRCDGTKHCAAGIATGQTCTVADRCADYSAFCEITTGTSGTCLLPKADGSSCSSNSQCQSYNCDMTAPRVCAVAPVCI
jgi:hypothetical protein